MGPAGRREAREQDELAPDGGVDVRAQLGIDVRVPGGGEESFQPITERSVQLSEFDTGEVGVMRDNARLGELGTDSRDTARHMLPAENAAQLSFTVYAVQKRDYHRVAAQQGPAELAGTFGVIELGCEEHDVDGADASGIIGGAGRLDVRVTARTLHAQAAIPDGLEMRAARDEADVVSRRRQARAEITADPAAAHDRNLHVALASIRITLSTSRCPISFSRLRMDSG